MRVPLVGRHRPPFGWLGSCSAWSPRWIGGPISASVPVRAPSAPHPPASTALRRLRFGRPLPACWRRASPPQRHNGLSSPRSGLLPQSAGLVRAPGRFQPARTSMRTCAAPGPAPSWSCQTAPPHRPALRERHQPQFSGSESHPPRQAPQSSPTSGPSLHRETEASR